MRIFKMALQNSFRDFWLSLASIIVMFLMLFSLCLIYYLNVVGQKVLTSFKDKMDLGIYLKQNINETAFGLLLAELENMSEIKEIQYLNQEQSLEKFEQKHQDDPLILKSLEELGKNPFGGTINIKFNNPTDYQKVLEIIQRQEYQDLIQNQDFYDYQNLIQGFNKFSQKASYLGLGVSGVFVFIAILVIFNTIKLGALSRQKQIEIMRLVGATSWFIRAPALIESGFYALIAWIFTLGTSIGVAVFIQPRLQQFLEINFNLFSYLKTEGLTFGVLLLIFALFVSMLGSSLAIKKYLKV